MRTFVKLLAALCILGGIARGDVQVVVLSFIVYLLAATSAEPG